MLHKLSFLLPLIFITSISSAQTAVNIVAPNYSSTAVATQLEEITPVVNPTQIYVKERAKFEQAKSYLATGKRLKFAELQTELADYPLAPYLEYAYIAAHLRHVKSSRVDEFLKHHSDSSLGKRLRYIWLENLLKRDKWQQFIIYYVAKNATTEQQCFYQYARYRNGDKQQALEATLALWKVGKSQPKACDKMFGVVIKQNLITEDIAWQRLTDAVINHEVVLARYLKRFFVSPDYKDKAELYYTTHRNPVLIAKQEKYTDNLTVNTALIQHSIAHLAKTSDRKATNLWLDYSKKIDFSDSETSYVVTNLLKYLYKNMHDAIADDLLRSSINPETTSLVENRIRKALATLDWASVRYWIKRLPAKSQATDRWKYWIARAEEQLSPQDTSIAIAQFKQLAQERSFFGYLAADKVSQPYLLKDKPVVIAKAIWEKVSNNASLIRSRELFLLKEYTSARREWQYLSQTADADTMIAAAKLASDWGWHSQAAFGIVIVKQWDDLTLRFPSDYVDLYRKSATEYQLPVELMLALSRQESSFATDALSPSGAKGLMQLMPKTAKYIARKSNINYRHERQLLEAEKNIQLGTSYYRYLMNNFDDNRILSTASYNAGPSRSRQWLKKTAGAIPADVWTEIIPFNETRRYVQNVLYFSVVYGQREGIEVKLLTENEQNTLL
ncbi:MAG: soluble lytic murein transglycosylase [Chitinophagales bacterium]|jgi:soluble lytic murein transglycosylase